MPLLSVVIATYKRPEPIARAVSSALAQSMSDLEVVVVVERDDELTAPALAAINDARVRIVVNPAKKGPAAARDYGVAQSVGIWIAFLDDDDEWDPNKLEKQLQLIGAGTRVICMTLSRVVVAGVSTTIRPTVPFDESEPVDEWLFDRQTWFKTSQAMLQTSSLVLPRALFAQVQFGQARHEEWELVMRAVKQHGYRLMTVREPLVTYYAGNLYKWRTSVEWVDSVRDLLSPKAYAGFCLTVATQGLQAPDRNLAMRTFFRRAISRGRPTAKQLFAFGMIWLLPDAIRHRLRAILQRNMPKT